MLRHRDEPAAVVAEVQDELGRPLVAELGEGGVEGLDRGLDEVAEVDVADPARAGVQHRGLGDGGDRDLALHEGGALLPAPEVPPGERHGDTLLLGPEDGVDLARPDEVRHRLPGDRQERVPAVHPGVGGRAAGEGLREAQLGVGRPLVGEAEADELAVRVEGVARGLGRDVAEARVERAVAHGVEVRLGRGERGRVGARQLLVPVVVVPQRVAHERALPEGRAAGRPGAAARARGGRRGAPAPAGEGERGEQDERETRGHSRRPPPPVCGLRRPFAQSGAGPPGGRMPSRTTRRRHELTGSLGTLQDPVVRRPRARVEAGPEPRGDRGRGPRGARGRDAVRARRHGGARGRGDRQPRREAHGGALLAAGPGEGPHAGDCRRHSRHARTGPGLRRPGARRAGQAAARRAVPPRAGRRHRRLGARAAARGRCARSAPPTACLRTSSTTPTPTASTACSAASARASPRPSPWSSRSPGARPRPATAWSRRRRPIARAASTSGPTRWRSPRTAARSTARPATRASSSGSRCGTGWAGAPR